MRFTILKLFAFSYFFSVFQSLAFSQIPENNKWQLQLNFNISRPIVNSRDVKIATNNTEDLFSKRMVGSHLILSRGFYHSQYKMNIDVGRSYWVYAIGTLRDTVYMTCPHSEANLGVSHNISLLKGYLTFGLGLQVVSHLKSQSKEYKTWFNGLNSNISYTRVKKNLGFTVGVEYDIMPIKGKYDGVFELYNDGYNWPVETRFQAIGLKVGGSYFLK